MTPHGPAGASRCSQPETESTGHGEELRANEEDFRLRSMSAEKAAGSALHPYHGHTRRNGKAKNMPAARKESLEGSFSVTPIEPQGFALLKSRRAHLQLTLLAQIREQRPIRAPHSTSIRVMPGSQLISLHAMPITAGTTSWNEKKHAHIFSLHTPHY